MAWQRHPEELQRAFSNPVDDAIQATTQQGLTNGVWIWPLSPYVASPNIANYLDFLYRGQAAHGLVLVDETQASKQLQELTQGHNLAYLVQWRDTSLMPNGRDVHGDPKHLVDFLLHKHGRLLEQSVFDKVAYATFELPDNPEYRLATTFTPLNVSFGNKVNLTAIAYGHTATSRQETADALEGKTLPAGHFAWVVLRWQPQIPLDMDLKTTLYLLDEGGHLAGQVDDLLVGDGYPLHRTWPADETASTYHILPTLPAIPPGRYQLYLGVYDLNRQQRYPVMDAQGRPGASAWLIGSLEVTRPLTTPIVAPSRILPAETSLTPGIFLLGYDLPANTFSPGERLPLTLYWQALTAPVADYRVGVGLRDAADRPVAQHWDRPANGRYPTTNWLAGEVLRDWQDLAIPVTLAAGDYRLVVTLSDDLKTVGQVALGSVRVSGRPRQFSPPTVGNPLSRKVNNQIAFLGYDLPSNRIQPGQPLTLTLYWQALAEMKQSYTVFVHLLGPDGRVWGQQDNPPGKGALPTTGWAPGEYITDPYEIPLKPDAPPGEYQVEIGLYDAVTGARLPVTDTNEQAQGDRILLSGRFHVER